MEKHDDVIELKGRQGFEWFEGASGTSYLCPRGSIHDKARVTEEQLKRVCVEESSNLHND